jgi:hypothetical protein
MNSSATIADRHVATPVPPTAPATDRIDRPSPSGRDEITRSDGFVVRRRTLPAGTDAFTGD